LNPKDRTIGIETPYYLELGALLPTPQSASIFSEACAPKKEKTLDSTDFSSIQSPQSPQSPHPPIN
jgi:hypothetical protein